MKSGGWSDSRVRPLVESIWNYHHVHHELAPADAILVLCSHDTVVAERGAQLWLEGWAPLLIFSGGLGTITRHSAKDPEADRFARIAVGMGVPEDRILIENRSTNTGENVLFTERLLADRQMDPQTFIVVQKPYMERRSYATFPESLARETGHRTARLRRYRSIDISTSARIARCRQTTW